MGELLANSRAFALGRVGVRSAREQLLVFQVIVRTHNKRTGTRPAKSGVSKRGVEVGELESLRGGKVEVEVERDAGFGSC